MRNRGKTKDREHGPLAAGAVPAQADRMTRRSEDSLISRYFAPLAGPGGLGLRDDAGIFTPKVGNDVVVTADALAAGIHFFPDDPPASIARKALAVNVSDLAAKGADPTGFLLTLALPEDWTDSWLAKFAQGLGQAARDWDCPLLGGDTLKASGGLTLSIAALGEVPAAGMVPRTTARIGDLVCVTGTIGDAALGLTLRGLPGGAAGGLAGHESLKNSRLADAPRGPGHATAVNRWITALPTADSLYLIDRYLHPQPRIGLRRALREHARAAMDVSDGLAGDLAKMLRASGVTARIEADRIPLSPAARLALDTDPRVMDRILTGGDDYEILCTVAPEHVADFQSEAHDLGLTLVVIGQVVEGTGLPVFRLGRTERRFSSGSFSHF